MRPDQDPPGLAQGRGTAAASGGDFRKALAEVLEIRTRRDWIGQQIAKLIDARQLFAVHGAFPSPDGNRSGSQQRAKAQRAKAHDHPECQITILQQYTAIFPKRNFRKLPNGKRRVG
jgi:hypothetical protein